MFPGNNPLNYAANNRYINNNFNNNFNNMNNYNNQMSFQNNNYAQNNDIINPLNHSYSFNFFQTQNYRNLFNNNQMNLINNNNGQNVFNNPMNNIMNFNNFQNNMNMNKNNNIQNDFIDNNIMQLNANQNNLCNQVKNLNLNLNNSKNNKNNGDNSQNMKNQILNNSDNENENVINYVIKEEDLQFEEKLSKATENIVSTMEGTINIYNQIKNNCICAILFTADNNTKTYTGFFCYIPYKNKKIAVLMTTRDAINENYSSDKLYINFDCYKTSKAIKMNKNRILYSSDIFNLTIIEIKPEDNLDNKNFLELDDNLFKNNSEIIYENKSLYILYYHEQKGPLVSYGSLNKKVSHNLIHLCQVEESSAGAPILNLENNKVIGLHTFSKKSPYYNMGSFLKYAINDLNKFKNQIGIIVEVNEYDLNKEVYFLNQDQNYAGELNEANTKLFIDNKEYKYKKYFYPKKKEIIQ